MTVSSTTRKVGPFLGNGVTTAFPFTFKVFTTADITLTRLDASGASTTLTLGADYSIALNADQDNNPGGAITYPLSGSPLAVGLTLTGLGSLAASQGTDITNAGRFLPQVVEDAFDRLTILAQQVLEKVNRALAAPVSESGVGALPTAANRANKFLVFDNDGNPIAASGTGADAGLRTDLAASTGSALLGWVQAGTGAVLRLTRDKLRDTIDLRDFLTGAEQADLLNSTPLFDLTSKLALAQTQAETFGSVNGKYPRIKLPAGNIGCAGFVWNKNVSLEGQEVGNTRLVYVGADNLAGSYIVGLLAGSGAVPFAGFYNIDFVGYEPSSTANPACENGILNLGTNLDWGFKLQNVHFQNFYGDAAQLRGVSSVFVNLFLNRVRFDSVGGFGIYLGSNNLNSGSPFVLDQFTLDNNISGNYLTNMTTQGRYDGSRWGKGLLRVEDGQNIGARITNARVELNKKLIAHNGGFALIYSNQTLAGARCMLSVENIQGTARQDQPVSIVRDVTGRTDFDWQQIGMSNYARLFADDVKPERDIYRNQAASGLSDSIVAQQMGMTMNGHSFGEFRPNPPEQVGGNFASYKFGDLAFNTTLGAGRAVAWQCKTPTSGFAVANSNNITTTAVVTATSAAVGVSSNILSVLAIGLNVTLVGAGAAGVDLPTRITGVDEIANTITVADVPSTSVNPATIKNNPAAFAPVLYAPGVSADKGNNNITVTLGVNEPTQYFNTPLTGNKAVTLAASAANLGTIAQANGGKFRIVRTAASTGAFTLDIAHNAGTKSLAAGQWADFEFNGTVWILTAAGSL